MVSHVYRRGRIFLISDRCFLIQLFWTNRTNELQVRPVFCCIPNMKWINSDCRNELFLSATALICVWSLWTKLAIPRVPIPWFHCFLRQHVSLHIGLENWGYWLSSDGSGYGSLLPSWSGYVFKCRLHCHLMTIKFNRNQPHRRRSIFMIVLWNECGIAYHWIKTGRCQL
jgi:hypothetical protein